MLSKANIFTYMHWFAQTSYRYNYLNFFGLSAVHVNLEILNWTCYSIPWPLLNLISYIGNPNKMMIVLHLKNSSSEFLISAKPFLYLDFIIWCVCLLFLTFLGLISSTLLYVCFPFFFFFQDIDGRELSGGTKMVNHFLQASLKWWSNFTISFFVYLFINWVLIKRLESKH